MELKRVDPREDADPWLPAGPARRNDAKVCLVCIPHAGAMHSSFSKWPAFFSEQVEVRAVAMPGRSFRFRETPATDLNALVQCLVAAIEALPWRNVAIFGDCSGANIALALAKALGPSQTRVLHLFAAGIPDPITPDPDPRHRLSESQFRAWALEERLLPPYLLESPAHADYFLQQVRSDYQLVETYRETPIPIDCPITTFVGSIDRLAARTFEVWSELTTVRWSHREVAAGHLVGLDEHHQAKAIIAEELDMAMDVLSAATLVNDSTESVVAGLWQEVFSVPSIESHTNFFTLGGDSRSAVELTRKLVERFNIELNVTAVFQFPTVGELAHVVDEARAGRPQEMTSPSDSGPDEILI